VTHSYFELRFKVNSYMYICRLVKTRKLHPGLLIIAILSLSFPWLLISTSHLLPFICLISSLISPFLFIYYLSILVEVLLRLLTHQRDLVLLYLVSGDYS
jgi:hypothetical protein